MQDFMKGRYGVDDLTLSLGVLGMVLALIGSLASLAPLSWIALVVVVLAILRAFSKSIPARERENQMFLDLARKIPVVGPHIGWLDREKGPRPASSASAQRPAQAPAPTLAAPSAPPSACGVSARPRCSSAARPAVPFFPFRAARATFA